MNADMTMRADDRLYCSFADVQGIPEGATLEARFGTGNTWHPVGLVGGHRALLVHGPAFVASDSVQSVLVPKSCQVWLRISDAPERFSDPVGVLRVI